MQTTREKVVTGNTPVSIKLVVWILGILTATLTAYGLTKVAIAENRIKIDTNTHTIEKVEVKINTCEASLIRQETHYEHIIDSVDDIKKKLETM